MQQAVLIKKNTARSINNNIDQLYFFATRSEIMSFSTQNPNMALKRLTTKQEQYKYQFTAK